ncbi:DUF308 domain-containing protein [Leptolyngbya sp. FACHB-17]|uniref:HdeD family acid-resistance protein n=1 Tax=unclassified Leptolyngbya TaxID=2650499 RepID=UPI0016814C9C|nr:DUF308 domain-containing protein [Leptolyngbya sp. FACHB-17]MBD2078991.1 DUF308 domain-containing protein [Leptolyngbya sp. FACHB-17]
MTASIEQPKSRNGALWSGILLIALGLGAVVAPVFSTLVSETWIALIILSAGFTKLVYAVQTRNQGGFLWKILLSSLYIATGIMLFASPLTGVLTLTLLLGSFLLTEGAFELILAFRMREQKNWFWLLGNAIITAGLGALIWSQYPSNAPWLLGTLVGASIFASGFSRVMFSLNPQAQSETPATSA